MIGSQRRSATRWSPEIRVWSSFFFQAEDGIRDPLVTGVQTCALPISSLLFGLFRFATAGAIDERVDHAAGRYQVAIAGQGAEVTTRIESEGILRGGRWTP